ncbi:ABC transporter transmembrane domain-containing protein [Litorivicinus lipolyticus]|uniref:ABC transporter transmembrane domain-containing protein n=1 Tax=Litorivicinus lipolyticus TaxID=418701 RepID=UPI001FEC105F|nr:ABC transporter transmembrane domain-containing protein [Litorivicinus lipolyticus]
MSAHPMPVMRTLWGLLGRHKKVLAIAAAALLTTSGLTLLLGQGIRWMVDEGLVAADVGQLKLALSGLMTLAVLMAVGTYLRFYAVSWLGERVSADLRRQAFDNLIGLHPHYFERNLSGEIMSRITADTTVLQSLIGSSVSMALRNSLMMTGGLVMMLATSPRLTLIILITVPAVLAPIMILGRRVRSLSRQSQDRLADVGQNAIESIQEIKTVQAFNQVARTKVRFANEVESAFDVARRRIAQRSFLIATVIILVFGGLSLMLWVGGQDVISGVLSAGEMSAFVFYALLVAMGAGTLAEVISEVQRAGGALERLIELINLDSLIDDPAGPAHFSAAGQLTFDGVSFAYPSRPDEPVLTDLSFHVQPGQTLALVGPSGAGKSTVFELIQRFHEPSHGHIQLDGVAINSLSLSQLRAAIAVVPQQPSLFSASIADNIRFGRPDASDREVYDAAEQAGADAFIRAIPEGYDAFVGERGVRLSGGQRQRIAIARALLTQPKLLLLDEATSALDSNSERHIQRALRRLKGQMSCLIIAHRLSTIEHADQILVIQHGRVQAAGTHTALLTSSELYRQLHAQSAG